jgi:Polyketide cyclase / dehydrase and lipid transport
VQDHTFSVDVDGSPEEVWRVFWSHRSGTREHGDVTIEILHPGDDDGEGLVRHCTFPVPRWLLSGGRGVSWEWLTEVQPRQSWRYDAVGKPLWSKATGWTRLEDLGGGRTRIHFRETYYAFNPLLRRLFEARVHRAISKSNDETLAASIEKGIRGLRAMDSGPAAAPVEPPAQRGTS